MPATIFTKAKLQLLLSVIVVVGFSSCALTARLRYTSELMTDIVCGKQVAKEDAYSFRFQGVWYYFDSNNCKETFKHNPKKYVSGNYSNDDRVTNY